MFPRTRSGSAHRVEMYLPVSAQQLVKAVAAARKRLRELEREDLVLSSSSADGGATTRAPEIRTSPEILRFADRASVLLGPDALICGTVSSIGRFVFIGDGCIVRGGEPSSSSPPIVIGDFVFFGRGCIVHSSVRIGSCCVVDDGSVLEEGCEIRDGVRLNKGSVVAPNQTLASRGVYGGNPAVLICGAPASIVLDHREAIATAFVSSC